MAQSLFTPAPFSSKWMKKVNHVMKIVQRYQGMFWEHLSKLLDKITDIQYSLNLFQISEYGPAYWSVFFVIMPGIVNHVLMWNEPANTQGLGYFQNKPDRDAIDRRTPSERKWRKWWANFAVTLGNWTGIIFIYYDLADEYEEENVKSE